MAVAYLNEPEDAQYALCSRRVWPACHPDHVTNFGAKVPLNRAGQPSKFGPAYVILASTDSSYITGQVIHPNGGEAING